MVRRDKTVGEESVWNYYGISYIFDCFDGLRKKVKNNLVVVKT